MMSLGFAGGRSSPVTILCLGAHSDDIEIGCGATLLSLKRALPAVRLHWVVFSASGQRGQEAAHAAELFTAGSNARIVLKDYGDGFFPYLGGEIKRFFEELKGELNPDLIFTHWKDDAHQDHRLVSELTWNTFRDNMILEYEIPKYDGDMGRPNTYVPLDASICEQKVDHLFRAFQSQTAKRWFDRQTFMGLMRIRGMESNSASGYAEAFYSRKLVLDPAH
jgi:LmbE family N-acetylglucosaminyl deacetylase